MGKILIICMQFIKEKENLRSPKDNYVKSQMKKDIRCNVIYKKGGGGLFINMKSNNHRRSGAIKLV